MINLDAGTLLEALRSSAQSDRSLVYINGKSEERALPYENLWQRALKLLGCLRAAQINANDELILFVENNEEFVDAFWACQLGGIVAVPLAIGPSDTHILKLFNVFRILGRPKLYCTEKNLRRLEKYSIAQNLENEYESMRKASLFAPADLDLRPCAEPADIRPEQTAFIQFSSGSTGDPKGVVLSHRNVMTNVRGILKGVKIRGSDSSLSWMPLTHDMGIIGFHIAPLVACAPQYLMPPELFVRRPILWLHKISEKRITITASPNFGYKHLLRRFSAEPGEFDLSCVRVVFNGAEPISASLCREFAKAMAPFGYRDAALFPVYGLAEASLAVTFSDPDSPFESVFAERGSLSLGHAAEMVCGDDPRGIELVSVGSAIPGCEVMISDHNADPVESPRIGHILIRGDNVTAGYYGNEELNLQVIKKDRWLDTGDLGFMSRGRLFIAGREKDLIILNGQNFHPHDLESLVENSGRIEAGRVAAFGLCGAGDASEALAIFVMDRGPTADFIPTIREVRRLLSERAGVHAQYVLPVPAIPKTTSGKIQRYLLAEQFQRGEFEALIQEIEKLLDTSSSSHNPDEDGIQGVLLQICRSLIEDREIGIEDNLFELGISSLKLSQIHEQIEKHFPDLLEVTDLFECPSVRELSRLIEHRHQSGT